MLFVLAKGQPVIRLLISKKGGIMNKLANFVIRLGIVWAQTVLIGIAVTATAAAQTLYDGWR